MNDTPGRPFRIGSIAPLEVMSILFVRFHDSGQTLAEIHLLVALAGRGKEVRWAFSGLFGRFCTCAYPTRYHDFVWFAPIDGEPTNISKRLRVVRLLGKSNELPD